MDSRLLNVVFDDPFDDNYVKYDDTDFWASGSESMGMQLTETLNGILPIAPTEVFYENELFSVIDMQNSKNKFIHNGEQMTSGQNIEIVKVDANTDGYDSDSENDEDSDNEVENDFLDCELESQHSNATFCTRTDSSSIGDYESHTSDYDDDDDDDKESNLVSNDNVIQNFNNSIIDVHSNLLANDDFVLDISYRKNDELNTSNTNSDFDGLGLQIDANNFDLADFITKDDFQLNIISTDAHKSNAAQKRSAIDNDKFSSKVDVAPVRLVSTNTNDSDSDSDVIIDVETIEVDEDDASCLRKASEICKSTTPLQIPSNAEEETPFIDNIKSDPSWSPKAAAKKVDKIETLPNQKPNFIRNFALVPNKKQCDLLKGKFAKGKGKNSQKLAKVNAAKSIKTEISPLKQISEKTTPNVTANSEDSLRRTSVGTKQNSNGNKTPTKLQIFHCSVQQKNPATVHKKILEETPAQKAEAVKRKLNLEEYKKRREEEGKATSNTPLLNSKFLNKIPKIDNKTGYSQTNDDRKCTINIAHSKHSENVTSIVKTLKEQQCLARKIVTDPITEAKNKVLRMQEMKKAQQMKIIDSTICSKVPRVTRLLPLKEIVKGTSCANEEEKKALNTKSTKSDYEEIVIVSASCNTDISIPPIPNPDIHLINNATRSLLKSSALLSTITNTFQKVKSIDNTKLTSSLISSIKDVVVKKTLPVEDSVVSEDFNGANKPEHHGEDKIIMHLRKDRIKKRMCSIRVQTDLQLEFPPLQLLKSSIQTKSRGRTRGYCKRQYRRHNDPSSSSSSDSNSDDQSDNSKSSTISRSRDNSCSSSLERVRTYDSAIGTGGYSSRSSLKHRSSISSSYSEYADHMNRSRRQRRTSYTKRSAPRKHSQSPYSSSSYTSDSEDSRSSLYRRSRSRSNSRSHSRSRSKRSRYHQSQNKRNNFEDRNVPQPAVEERRIVYVGRIEQETTKEMLRRKFFQYGSIKQISIHYKDTGMKYGFVTFQRSEDAFAAIDNSTRDPQINMYDVSFGGRRAFCRSSYADLDNAGINTYHSYVFPQPVEQPKEEDSFEALLMKMKAKLKANKANKTNSSESTSSNGQSKVNNKI